MPGSTQSLSFGPAAGTAGTGARGPRGPRGQAEAAQAPVRIAARTVRPYSLLGVVWDRVDAPLHGRVQVRTRDAGTGVWSGWRGLDVHPGEARRETVGERARGATAPLWTGPSDGVEARVVPDRRNGTSFRLPTGLRLELVDPGPEPAGPQSPAPSAPPAPANPGEPENSQGPSEPSTPPAQSAPGEPAPGETVSGEPAPAEGQPPGTPGARDNAAGTGAEGVGGGSAEAGEGAGASVLPALSREATQSLYATEPALKPHMAPRPRIVTRKGWGANEKLREPGHAYTKSVKVVFVHHTAGTNAYNCKQGPSIIRAMYRYHVKSSKWRDIGYNFLVDKCGTIYEGRAGGVAKAVRGAHTYGFNANSTGVAVIGSYDRTAPPKAALDALSRLSAWKLALFGVDAGGRTRLTSGGGKFKKGHKISFHTVSGHKDGYVTECPGARLYGKLGAIRSAAARLQGR
ncbi:peptidoglycan recognition protein [Streptomyces albus subsp. chlorinus]|uniref:peptidoglycan recognition protein family protein n=1 Tax=Streptomyces albus TaxID=1888 RepID=UPI0031F62D7B